VAKEYGMTNEKIKRSKANTVAIICPSGRKISQ
jgi:hypothetical protein